MKGNRVTSVIFFAFISMLIIGEQQSKGNENEQEVGIHEAEAERQRR